MKPAKTVRFNMSLKPFVYWAQTETDLFLKVDVKKVEGQPDICIEEEEIEFTAKGIDNQSEGLVEKYHFVLEFFLPVDPSRSMVDIVDDKEIRICLKKKEPDWWPRLLFEQKKLSWLKIDFDKWKSNDLDDSEDDASQMLQDGLTASDALRHKYPDVYRQLQKEELGYISESRRKIYLFCYNMFMFCGFLHVFAVISIHFAREGEEFIPKTYRYVGNVFKMLHLLMGLEILHPFFGYTKSSVKEAVFQIGAKNFILFALIDAEPRMQEKPVVFYLFIIYTAIELIKYPYYMLRTYDIDFIPITWLRYTIFLPAYPAQYVCEGVIMLRDIPYFEETKQFSIMLPNNYNFGFYFPYMLRVYLLFGFFPILYTTMNYMYQLRCKRLNIKQHRLNRPKKED